MFDYFFPGVIVTDLLHTPDIDYLIGRPAFTAIATALAAGFAAPGNPTLQFASVAGLTGTTPKLDTRIRQYVRRVAHRRPARMAARV